MSSYKKSISSVITISLMLVSLLAIYFSFSQNYGNLYNRFFSTYEEDSRIGILDKIEILKYEDDIIYIRNRGDSVSYGDFILVGNETCQLNDLAILVDEITEINVSSCSSYVGVLNVYFVANDVSSSKDIYIE